MMESSAEASHESQRLWLRLWDTIAAAADWPARLSALAYGWRDITQAQHVRIFAMPVGGGGWWRLDLDGKSTVDCQHVAVAAGESAPTLEPPPSVESEVTRHISVTSDDRLLSSVFVTGAVARSAPDVELLTAYTTHVLGRPATCTSLVDHPLSQSSSAAADAEHTPLTPDDFRLESLAEFAAGAGHEINNPLATIIGRVQLLLRAEEDPGRRQALEAIGGQAYRIRDMIGDAMLFARPPLRACESQDLSRVVQEVVQTCGENYRPVNCELQLNLAAEAWVWADPDQLGVVVSSLVRNAMEAVDEGGRVAIETIVAAGEACLVISNSGDGLSDTERSHLFDPFFSGRSAGRGLGFGLSKCWRIVSNHGGRIECQSAPDCSTTLTVFWPTPR